MTIERLQSDSLNTGPDPYSDQFESATAVADGHVEVIHGVHAHSLPLAGMTIARARHELADRMNIPLDAGAIIDGEHASEDTVLQEGQVLNFMTNSGEKGVSSRR